MTLDEASLRRPSPVPAQLSSYVTKGGIRVERRKEAVDGRLAVESLIDALDTRRGVLLSSNYDYPGRYTRWDLGLKDPLLEFSSQGRTLEVKPCCERGELLVPPIRQSLAGLAEVESIDDIPGGLRVVIRKPERRFAEEERSRQPSVFSAIRRLVELFYSTEDD